MCLEVRTELLLDGAAARGPRRLGDKVITRPQTATAEAMARAGVGPK